MRIWLFCAGATALLVLLLHSHSPLDAQTSKRTLNLDDMLRLKEVRDPQVSPDGKWVAYRGNVRFGER
jgi:hypothetical protein